MTELSSSYDATRHCRNLLLLEGQTDTFGKSATFIYGRATAEVGPRLYIEVPPSGATGVVANGGKCEHGVYIPAPFLTTNRAPDCSLCRPYEIGVRENGRVYKA